MKHFSSATSLI